MNSKVKETLGSRKFWLTILISGLALGLFLFGHIDIDRMTEIVRWAAGIYVGGLSIEDAAKKLLPLIKAG
jgi:amino acid permease